MTGTLHVKNAVRAAVAAVVLALTACSSAQMRSAAEARAAWDAARAASSAPSQMPQVSQTAQVSPTSSLRGGSQPYATTVLAKLPVKGRAPKTGYDRVKKFGAPWTDKAKGVDGAGNGCDTRDDVLRRDLRPYELTTGSHGCTPKSGTLVDPYTTDPATGQPLVIRFVYGRGTSSAVQIDHVVALSDAWQKGAQQLTPDERVALANDPLNLIAVSGRTNAAKSDGDAATWQPRAAYRCPYFAKQVAVKAKYRLWVTASERDAMLATFKTCPKQRIPSLAATRVPAPKAAVR